MHKLYDLYKRLIPHVRMVLWWYVVRVILKSRISRRNYLLYRVYTRISPKHTYASGLTFTRAKARTGSPQVKVNTPWPAEWACSDASPCADCRSFAIKLSSKESRHSLSVDDAFWKHMGRIV